VGDIAAEMNADFSAVALAWVQSKGIIPILGPRDKAQFFEGLAAGEMILSAEQIGRLNTCSEPWNFTFNQLQESGVASPRNHSTARFGSPAYDP
jgi:diketogulonate reductase-like aldo/keto reductase